MKRENFFAEAIKDGSREGNRVEKARSETRNGRVEFKFQNTIVQKQESRLL